MRDVVGRSSDPQPPLPPDLDLLCESHPPVELLLTRAGVTGELPGEHRVGREEARLGESTARGVEIGSGCAQSGARDACTRERLLEAEKVRRRSRGQYQHDSRHQSRCAPHHTSSDRREDDPIIELPTFP